MSRVSRAHKCRLAPVVVNIGFGSQRIQYIRSPARHPPPPSTFLSIVQPTMFLPQDGGLLNIPNLDIRDSFLFVVASALVSSPSFSSPRCSNSDDDPIGCTCNLQEIRDPAFKLPPNLPPPLRHTLRLLDLPHPPLRLLPRRLPHRLRNLLRVSPHLHRHLPPLPMAPSRSLPRPGYGQALKVVDHLPNSSRNAAPRHLELA